MKKKFSEDIVSLPRALSKLGHCSRAQGVRLIEEGRVSVNGRRELDPRRRISLVKDHLRIDGRVVGQKKSRIYLCLNKPRGIVTTRSDERGAATVYNLLGKQASWIFPVGRLDKESSGLLLFTNDAQFSEMLTNPESHHPKVYYVKVDRTIHDGDLQKLSQGVLLNDGYTTLPAKIRRDKNDRNECSFILTLTEGKNRQIRRMCEALGYSVVELHRSSIGQLTIPDLESGKWRPITRQERNRALAQ